MILTKIVDWFKGAQTWLLEVAGVIITVGIAVLIGKSKGRAEQQQKQELASADAEVEVAKQQVMDIEHAQERADAAAMKIKEIDSNTLVDIRREPATPEEASKEVDESIGRAALASEDLERYK